MLYELLYPLKEYFFGFNLFRYISFRSAYAVVTALILVWVFTPWIINLARRKNIGENIRSDGPEKHQKKAGTPTMGGVVVLLSILVSILLWARLDNPYVWMVLAALAGFGLIGFLDDYLKLKKKKGLSAIVKFSGQFLVALGITLYLYHTPAFHEHLFDLYIPFMNKPLLDLGVWFIPFSMLVIVGASNAVNLTDGLDGLAIGLTLMVTLAFVGLTYASSNFKIAEYLRIPFIRNTAELTVISACLAGASLGFLWYNCHPAEIFMGDTGALSLGGVLGVMAVILRKEVILLIVGGVFVAELLSVVLQVASYKIRKKRIFLMAPLHHHFELKGWYESKVVIRFWIIGGILALIGLTTLKIL